MQDCCLLVFCYFPKTLGTTGLREEKSRKKALAHMTRKQAMLRYEAE